MQLSMIQETIRTELVSFWMEMRKEMKAKVKKSKVIIVGLRIMVFVGQED